MKPKARISQRTVFFFYKTIFLEIKEIECRPLNSAEPFAFVIFEQMAEHVCHYCFNMVVRDKTGKGMTTLLRCSSCKFARYCSRECQKKAWPSHKKECMAIRVGVQYKYDQRTLKPLLGSKAKAFLRNRFGL